MYGFCRGLIRRGIITISATTTTTAVPYTYYSYQDQNALHVLIFFTTVLKLAITVIKMVLQLAAALLDGSCLVEFTALVSEFMLQVFRLDMEHYI